MATGHDDDRPLYEVMPALLRPGGLQALAEAALRRTLTVSRWPCAYISREGSTGRMPMRTAVPTHPSMHGSSVSCTSFTASPPASPAEICCSTIRTPMLASAPTTAFRGSSRFATASSSSPASAGTRWPRCSAKRTTSGTADGPFPPAPHTSPATRRIAARLCSTSPPATVTIRPRPLRARPPRRGGSRRGFAPRRRRWSPTRRR